MSYNVILHMLYIIYYASGQVKIHNKYPVVIPKDVRDTPGLQIGKITYFVVEKGKAVYILKEALEFTKQNISLLFTSKELDKSLESQSSSIWDDISKLIDLNYYFMYHST